MSKRRQLTVKEQDRGTVFSPEGSPSEKRDAAEATGQRLTADQRAAKKAAAVYDNEK